MFFLNPSFLWALFGLSVPLAIHLWSKKQGKNIKVGSIKYLQVSDSRKSRNIKWNELWLLLLRMLIVLLVVIILSEPRLNYKTENSPITYLVEASLLDSPEVKALADSLATQAGVRFLQADFPEYEPDFKEPRRFESPNYWQLAREMQSLKTDSIVVFTNSFYSGIKGKRPVIDKNIHWINLSLNQAETHMVGIIKNENVREVISARSNAEQFKFQKKIQENATESIDSLPKIEKDSLRVNIYFENKFAAENKYLKASFSAIAKYLNHPVEVYSSEELDSLRLSSIDFLIWLREQPVPKTKAKLLKFQLDSLATGLIEPGNFKNEYLLTAQLNSENIVEEHLVEQLLKLMNLYPEIEKQAEVYDRRVMNLELLKPNVDSDSGLNIKSEGMDISYYLCIGLILLLISERILSRYRKQ
jgi:hypothetical protein